MPILEKTTITGMPETKSPISPHDRYVRSSFANPKIAREFFEEYLPPSIRKQVDLSTLIPRKESFINETLRTKIVDLLFSANFSGESGYLYVLMEHASTPDKMLPLRMLQYVLAIMDHHMTQTGEKTLPIVYPMIFYTGKRNYTHSTNIYDLFGENKKLAQSIYTKPFSLIDLNHVSDEQLKQYEWLSILGLVMKQIRKMDFLPIFKEMVSLLKRVISEGGVDYVSATLTYITEAGEIRDPNQFVEIIQKGLKEKERKVMTLAEHWKQEGIEIGKEKGIEQGRDQGVRLAAVNFLKTGLSVEQVANGTGLSVEEIEDLRQANFS